MAITRTTITKNIGWTRSDVIDQLEEGFTWAGKNGGPISGLVAGIAYPSTPTTIGGTVTGSSAMYVNVFPIATSGSGSGASFNLLRNSSTGKIVDFFPNRAGSGYADGDTITISANDIGGSTNGATNITVPIFIESTVTGGNTYNYTYTAGGVLSGTDINGTVSNVPASTVYNITIREGDTLNILNSMSNSFPVFVNFTDTTTSQDRAFQMLNVSNIEPYNFSTTHVSTNQQSGKTLSWTPRPGQAGTYYIRTFNINLSHQIVVLSNDSSRTFTPRSVGSTSAFWDKQAPGPDSLYPWGCMRQVTQSGKKYGDSFKTFQVVSPYQIRIGTGSYFRKASLVPGTFDRIFKGKQPLDLPGSSSSGSDYYYQFSDSNTTASNAFRMGYSSSEYNLAFCNDNATNSFSLDLNVFRSSLDPKFAIFSFKQPNLSSTVLSGNTFLTFFVHDFVTDIWDLDYVFLSGMTVIIPEPGNTQYPKLTFRTFCGGSGGSGGTLVSLRAAEAGYMGFGASSGVPGYTSASYVVKEAYYSANSYPYTSESYASNLYYRTNDSTDPTKNRGIGMPDESNFNALISGIPLNATLVPVPYYLPDDFVLVQFENSSPSLNVQQGDSLVVQSGVEEYVIIQGSYNQTTKTRGILLCARTV